MTATALDKYLELRLLVGYLGETEQCGWWPSGFFEATSLQFLTPVFARTARLAQYNGVSTAARRSHDANVGVGNVFHLFRFPGDVEQDLHRLAQSLKDNHPFVANLTSKGAAMERLETLAESEAASGQGPLAIGKVEDSRKPAPIRRLAAYYAGAFASGGRVYPYFTT